MCLEGLRGEERRVGGLLIGIAVGVAIWEVSCFPLSFPVRDRDHDLGLLLY
jgi:hypothetical protein